MVKKDKATGENSAEDYDSVKQFGGSPSSPRKRSPVKVTFPSIGEKKEDEYYEPVDDTENVDDVMWDAVMFATDADFLETSKTRLFFKNNAIVNDGMCGW